MLRKKPVKEARGSLRVHLNLVEAYDFGGVDSVDGVEGKL